MNNREKVKDFLKDSRIDGLLIQKDENVRYLSGFTGGESWLFFSEEAAYLLTDSRYTEQAKEEAPEIEIVNHEGRIAGAIGGLCERHGIKKLGVESVTTYEFWLKLQEIFSEAEFVVCHPDVLRQIKKTEELECIREACRIADEAFEKTIPRIKAGMTEKELRVILECAMLEGGSEGRSFETIVASGARSAYPHGVATDKKIQEGELITFDFGAMYKGYHSDMTRVVAVGEVSSRLRFLYDRTLDCVNHIESLIGPGVKASDMDREAREFLKRSELDVYFIHSLGHSVGLEIHETPTLSRGDNTILRVGMTETVEPGVYIPGVGGVRIEDTVVIEEKGIRLLTTFPKEFLQV